MENIDPLSRAATKIYGNVIKTHAMNARRILSERAGDRKKKQVIGYRREAIGNEILKLAA